MKQQPGFSLFEVLISLSLVSLSLLTLQATEQATMCSIRAVHFFRQASLLADNMSAYINAHHGDAGGYSSIWNEQIKEVLPEGRGIVTIINHHYQIIISWGGVSAERCNVTSVGIKGCLVVQKVLVY